MLITPFTALGMFGAATLAGVLGSMLGLGGGIIIIPALTLVFGVDFRFAAATSLFSVVATSIAGTSSYLRQGYTDIRLGLFLELATVLGAISGGMLAFIVSPRLLQALFAALIIYTSYAMWRDSQRTKSAIETPPTQSEEPAQGFSLTGHYYDPVSGQEIPYRARRFGEGMLASVGAGLLSGMLGVGGGIIKVPIMRLRMGVPLKVAAATSNYMIGITAATSVMLYFQRGVVDVPITAICALGILLGASLGARLAVRVHTRILQRIFILVLLFTAVQMIVRAVRGGL